MEDKVTSQPYWENAAVTIYHGDNMEVMRQMPNCSVDAVVTDPPYGLEFMGRKWDSFGRERDYKPRDDGYGNKGLLPHYGRGGRSDDVARFKHKAALSFQEFTYRWAQEVLRVLKPGGWLIAFGGTRTYHRLVSGIEDAGFEIRDRILYLTEGGKVGEIWPVWVQGMGFPKGLNISVALDETLGTPSRVADEVETNRTGTLGGKAAFSGLGEQGDVRRTHEPSSDIAKLYDGYNVALKPAHEPIVVARKPLEKGLSVAQNVLKWGTGGINIGACRIAATERRKVEHKGKVYENVADGYKRLNKSMYTHKTDWAMHSNGRWPANVAHDGSIALLDEFAQYGEREGNARKGAPGTRGIWSGVSSHPCGPVYGDTGSIARYFQAYGADERNEVEAQIVADVVRRFIYCPKASKRERDAGLDDEFRRVNANSINAPRKDEESKFSPRLNSHPTIKPISLLRELVRLVTPPNGIMLDPFNGSGSTGIACIQEGIPYIGIEQEQEYCAISVARLAYWQTRQNPPSCPKPKRAEHPDDLPLFRDYREAA